VTRPPQLSTTSADAMKRGVRNRSGESAMSDMSQGWVSCRMEM
jgi:hypothetical protein